MQFEELSPAERLIAEHAVLNLRTLNNACDMAADGTVLAIAEILAVEQARELTRKTLQASIDAQVDSVEKKSSPARTCECRLKKAHHGRKVREQVTCAGEIHLSRIYLKFARCSEGGYVADDRLGVAGRYSPEPNVWRVWQRPAGLIRFRRNDWTNCVAFASVKTRFATSLRDTAR